MTLTLTLTRDPDPDPDPDIPLTLTLFLQNYLIKCGLHNAQVPYCVELWLSQWNVCVAGEVVSVLCLRWFLCYVVAGEVVSVLCLRWFLCYVVAGEVVQVCYVCGCFCVMFVRLVS